MKKLVLISGVLLTIIIGICVYNNLDNNKEIISNSTSKKKVNTNALTMMYETSAGSGEYQVSSDTFWPQEGYIFNAELSGCENGGKLSWNSETKKVVMQTNSSDKCYVYFDKYTSTEITNVTASNITSNSITINVTASEGTNGIARYYYSSNNGSTWVNNTSSSYTFTNLSSGTRYTFRVYVEDTAGYESEQKSVSATTSNPTLADICAGKTFATCIKENVYTSDGVNDIYYHNGSGSYTNTDQEAGDNSYRYAGANPNNYVCFGSTAGTCPSDNLYRIIGVFGNQVKLIKATRASSSLLGTDGAYQSSYYYDWNNSTNNNTWSQSNLNTVNLNTNYLNNIGSTWSSKIATTSWKVGGNTVENIIYYPNGIPKNAYRNEIASPAESTTYSAKIGLMYVSDYYYGASPTYWTYPGYTDSSYPDGNGNSGSSYDYRAARSSNWMNTGYNEWTISRSSGSTNFVFFVNGPGFVNYGYGYNNDLGVRPSFYLNSSVTLSGGSGSSADPFRIA